LNDLQVGDVIQILEGESIPADCILLRTKKGTNGMCFVQTTDLDGERNLKPVFASKYIDYYFKQIFMDRKIKFSSEFIAPSKDMYFYDGRIKLVKIHPEVRT
jgi:hypothetical protein